VLTGPSGGFRGVPVLRPYITQTYDRNLRILVDSDLVRFGTVIIII
jgi:hypothetical protein